MSTYREVFGGWVFVLDLALFSILINDLNVDKETIGVIQRYLLRLFFHIMTLMEIGNICIVHWGNTKRLFTA